MASTEPAGDVPVEVVFSVPTRSIVSASQVPQDDGTASILAGGTGVRNRSTNGLRSGLQLALDCPGKKPKLAVRALACAKFFGTAVALRSQSFWLQIWFGS